MKLKPFDLEAAKAGAKVVTREGREARIICYDRKSKRYPIVALLESEENGEREYARYYDNNGKYLSLPDKEVEHENDLFMAPVKREGWVVVYKRIFNTTSENIFNTREYAEEHGLKTDGIAVAKIEWEG